jgi:hypothetical protein
VLLVPDTTVVTPSVLVMARSASAAGLTVRVTVATLLFAVPSLAW